VKARVRWVAGAAVGLGREAWAVGAALATYRARFAVPVRPAIDRAAWTNEPVVLVHGLGHTSGAWSPLTARLGAAGFFEFHPVTYGVHDDVAGVAARIAEAVDPIVASRAGTRVHLVGHSLGGVAIRYWHDLLGGDAHTDAVVTLGSPHLGTMWTRLPLLSAAARDLVVGSSVATQLDRRASPHDHWTTIGGTFDLLVPPSRAHLPDATTANVAAGHTGLLTSRTAAGHVCMALLHAEEQRRTERLA
jgi:pimeloyl-ACP methyl ester carboxylesterase